MDIKSGCLPSLWNLKEILWPNSTRTVYASWTVTLQAENLAQLNGQYFRIQLSTRKGYALWRTWRYQAQREDYCWHGLALWWLFWLLSERIMRPPISQLEACQPIGKSCQSKTPNAKAGFKRQATPSATSAPSKSQSSQEEATKEREGSRNSLSWCLVAWVLSCVLSDSHGSSIC